MESISKSEFEQLCQSPSLKIVKYGRGTQPKVFVDQQDNIIKLFYPKKRLLTSTRFRPQAIKFQSNIDRLRQYGYTVPAIKTMQYCRELNTYLVHYPKIIAEDVRTLVKAGQLNLINEVAQLLAELHQKGIIFRAIHLENLMIQPNGKFALIDISDVKFKYRPLGFYSRYRNFVHLFSNPTDRAFWRQYGYEQFLQLYFAAAKLTPAAERLITILTKRAMAKKN